MAQCSICSHEKVSEINWRILTGRQIVETAKEFGINRGNLYSHMRNHLPWRTSRRKPAPETIEEKFAELEFELSRLRALALCGEKVGEALRVVTAQRNLLELEMRKGGLLDASHKKLILNAAAPTGDVEVVYENGRARSRTVEAGEK